MRAWREHGISWAGLAAGPLAWALAFQIAYLLVPDTCGEHVFGIVFVSLLGILVCAAGGLLSWRAYGRLDAVHRSGAPGIVDPYRFLAGLSVLAASLFAFTLLLQAIASLIFHGCER
jgi:hypothetical protein